MIAMATARPAPPPAPLLDWPERRAANLVEIERLALRRRIARLKPRSHARIIAEDRLRALTHQALQIGAGLADILPAREPARR